MEESVNEESVKTYEEKPVNTRFIQIMNHFNYNKNTLALALGVSPPSIGHIEKHRNYPAMDTLLRFLSIHPDINFNWLVTGEGSMINRERNYEKEILDLNHQLRIITENSAYKTEDIRKKEKEIEEYKAKIVKLEAEVTKRDEDIEKLTSQIRKMKPL